MGGRRRQILHADLLEDTFGYLSRRFVLNGAEVIVNLTNDAGQELVLPDAARHHGGFPRRGEPSFAGAFGPLRVRPAPSIPTADPQDG
jgi:hypothetical protein